MDWSKMKKRWKIPAVLLCLAVLAVLCWRLWPGTGEALPPPADMDRGWELVLVNSEHSLPEDWEVELITLNNGCQVDERIYPDLQQMFDDMRALDIYPVVRDGWRSQEVQQGLLDDMAADYREQGYSRRDALDLAKQWVALPGTSEHQLGIAVDINPDTSMSTGDQVYGWLAEHAHEYGFILRYPPDKTDITGISNEPWHYRYVGREAAAEIRELGMCLEEYLDYLNGA